MIFITSSRNIQSSELNISNSTQINNQRINKKHARIRGSGLRNTKTAQSLTIDSSSNNENKRLVSQLSSALINKQDLELTRSTRRKSSILPYTIIDKLPPLRRNKKRVSFKEPDLNTEHELPDIGSPEEENTTPVKRTVGRPKKQKSLRGRKPKSKEDERQQQQEEEEEQEESDTSLLKAQAIDEKIAKVKQRIKESGLIGNVNSKSRKRINESSILDSPKSENSEIGLINGSKRSQHSSSIKKRKVSSGESSLISQPSSPPPPPPQPSSIRQQVIPTPSPEPDISDSEQDSDPDYGNSIIPNRRRQGANIISSGKTRRVALPLLSKTKSKITIDYPTLVNASNNRGRIQRARMLDVLRSLISTFEPPPSLTNNNLEIHERFKHNLLSNIDKLRDETTTIEDIAKNIHSVQKAKKELRKMMFDLKNDHVDIGNQLNQLRVNIKNKKQQFESLNLLTDQFKQTKEMMLMMEEKEEGGKKNRNSGLNDDVQLKLASLGKILNPDIGLCSKLEHINNKLEHLDESI